MMEKVKKKYSYKKYQKAWRKKNLEHVKRKSREYYLKNKEQILKRNKENEKKSGGRYAELRKRWKKEHPEIVRVMRHRRRAADGKFTEADIKKLYLEQKKKCACCGRCIENNYHVDHIKPIARGGTNWPKNLQLLHPNCNRRKADKLPEEWAKENVAT